MGLPHAESSRRVGESASFLPASHCSLLMSCCGWPSTTTPSPCSHDASQAEILTISPSLDRCSNAPNNSPVLSGTKCSGFMTRYRTISKPNGRRMKQPRRRRLCSVRSQHLALAVAALTPSSCCSSPHQPKARLHSQMFYISPTRPRTPPLHHLPLLYLDRRNSLLLGAHHPLLPTGRNSLLRSKRISFHRQRGHQAGGYR